MKIVEEEIGCIVTCKCLPFFHFLSQLCGMNVTYCRALEDNRDEPSLLYISHVNSKLGRQHTRRSTKKP